MAASADLGVAQRPGWETVTALITVKAYPVIGQKTGESVCVAGVRLDQDTPRWVRLFPVPFRQMPRDKQFEKYRVVQLRARHAPGADRRPESLRPDLESLVLGEKLGTENGTWRSRWEILEPLAGATTTCRLHRDAKDRGQAAPSLGLVNAVELDDVRVERNPDYNAVSASAPDVDLFGSETRPLEAAPVIAKCHYRCAEPGCNGHRQTVVDWETGVLARRLLRAGATVDEVCVAVRDKYVSDVLSESHERFLFVGNQHQHPQSFLVLGFFTPRSGSKPPDRLF